MDLPIRVLAALHQPERWPLVRVCALHDRGRTCWAGAHRAPEAGDAKRPRGRRYVLQTLRNSGSSVDTIDEADVVYVYDYCYHMRALADDHARRHWWLKDQYDPERTVGKHLISCYRRAWPRLRPCRPLR